MLQPPLFLQYWQEAAVFGVIVVTIFGGPVVRAVRSALRSKKKSDSVELPEGLMDATEA